MGIKEIKLGFLNNRSQGFNNSGSNSFSSLFRRSDQSARHKGTRVHNLLQNIVLDNVLGETDEYFEACQNFMSSESSPFYKFKMGRFFPEYKSSVLVGAKPFTYIIDLLMFDVDGIGFCVDYKTCSVLPSVPADLDRLQVITYCYCVGREFDVPADRLVAQIYYLDISDPKKFLVKRFSYRMTAQMLKDMESVLVSKIVK